MIGNLPQSCCGWGMPPLVAPFRPFDRSPNHDVPFSGQVLRPCPQVSLPRITCLHFNLKLSIHRARKSAM